MDVRPATEADLVLMIEAMFAEPSVEQVAFMPTLAGARRFTEALWRRVGLAEFLVADDDGHVVGFAWCSENNVRIRDGYRAATIGWGPLGPIRLALKGWPRQLVELPMPAGRKLIELQVHPSRRGSGVGSALLVAVIEASESGSLSLTTRSNNPARRLYERHGFAVIAEKTSAAFERRTGSKGRIMMVRTKLPS